MYAEQTVDVTSAQLTNRCEPRPPCGPRRRPRWRWHLIGTTGVTAVLDNDGNADVTFEGISCASGPSLVDAELVGGTHDTFTTTFTISPPALTDV